MKSWMIAGLGFLAGNVLLKAAKSETAKRGYVYAMAQGMKAKKEYSELVERAKAEFDDMAAEANYIVASDEDVKKAEEKVGAKQAAK